MKNKTFILFALLTLYSCGKKGNFNVPFIEVDSSQATASSQTDFTSINFIPVKLPDTLLIGEITHIKSYGDYYFLHDENQTKTISVVDKTGEFIGQLNKPGQGPGEFTELSAFTFDEGQKTIYVYDRSLLNIQAYSFPSFDFIRTITMEKYLMNLEFLENSKFLQVSENVNPDKSYEGILATDLNGSLVEKFDIGVDPASIEISYPNTISRIDNQVYYAHPHTFTTLYRLGKTAEPLFQIDFGNNKISEKYWNNDEAEGFEQALFIEPPKATWVQNLWISEEQVSFNYMFKDVETRYTAVYNRLSNEVRVFDEFLIPGSEMQIPAALGVSSKGTLSLLYSDSIDPEDAANNPQLLKAYQKTNKQQDLIIIEYVLKP